MNVEQLTPDQAEDLKKVLTAASTSAPPGQSLREAVVRTVLSALNDSYQSEIERMEFEIGAAARGAEQAVSKLATLRANREVFTQELRKRAEAAADTIALHTALLTQDEHHTARLTRDAPR